MRVRKAVCGIAAAVAVVGSLVVLSPPAGATSDPGAEGDFIARTNGLRTSHGLAPLSVNGTLTAKARAWAEHMAAVGAISHSNLPDGAPPEWHRLGENVGSGPSVDSIHNALVASPEHYANLTDPGFQSIGVGVVNANGTYYVSEVFMESASQPAPSTSSPRAATPSPGSPQPVRSAPAAAPAPPPVFLPAWVAWTPDERAALVAMTWGKHHVWRQGVFRAY
ncbi:MAG: CAP domain-containing protein [Acidimicrobiia bacterium]